MVKSEASMNKMNTKTWTFKKIKQKEENTLKTAARLSIKTKF
jgi:hypothetical protein